jgi:putative transcriptional regulator
VALIRMTLDDVKAQAAARSPEEQAAFQRRMAATTEADIHRQMIEDDEDPQTEPCFAPPVLAQDVRKKLGLTQAAFATLLGIPVATLRNWEQNRFVMEPSAQTLLKLIDREPEAALRALRGPQAA